MLIDAIRAEGFRLSRNRMLMFWSVIFVPVLYVIGGVIYHFVNKAKGDSLAAAADIPATLGGAPIDLGPALVEAANMSANGAILTFTVIAAATLYAGDYRWETWRLITARNTRFNLILGKVAAFVGLALAAMFAFLVAYLIYTLTQAAIFQRPLSFSFGAAQAGHFGALGGLGLVRIVQYSLIALLTAVLTRSLLAALFVPIVLGVAQGFFGQAMVLVGWEPSMWRAQLLLPGLAFDTLKAAVMGDGPLPDSMTLKSAISLLLWTAIPLAGAIAWFKRQDLSKE